MMYSYKQAIGILKTASINMQALQRFNELVSGQMSKYKNIPVRLKGINRLTGNVTKAQDAQLTQRLGQGYSFQTPGVFKRLSKPVGRASATWDNARRMAAKSVLNTPVAGTNKTQAQLEVLPLMLKGTTPVAPDSLAIRQQVRETIPAATQFGRQLRQSGFSSRDVSDILRNGSHVNSMLQAKLDADELLEQLFRTKMPAELQAAYGDYNTWLQQNKNRIADIRSGSPGVALMAKLKKLEQIAK